MRQAVGPDLGVKAAGGVKNLEQAQEMIKAGATRIGASAGVKIVQESRGEKVEPRAVVANIRTHPKTFFQLKKRMR